MVELFFLIVRKEGWAHHQAIDYAAVASHSCTRSNPIEQGKPLHSFKQSNKQWKFV